MIFVKLSQEWNLIKWKSNNLLAFPFPPCIRSTHCVRKAARKHLHRRLSGDDGDEGGYFVFTLFSCFLLHLHFVSASISASRTSLANSVQTDAMITNVTTAVTNIFLVFFCPCLAIIPVLRMPEWRIQEKRFSFDSESSLPAISLFLSLAFSPSCVPHLLQVNPIVFSSIQPLAHRCL